MPPVPPRIWIVLASIVLLSPLAFVSWPASTINTAVALIATATLAFVFAVDLRWQTTQRKRSMPC